MPALARVRLVNFSNELKKAPSFGYNPTFGRSLRFGCACKPVQPPPSILDGGSANINFTTFYNGGNPYATGNITYSGGDPGPPLPPPITYSGGDPSASGQEVYSGGNANSTGRNIFTGGSSGPLFYVPSYSGGDPSASGQEVYSGGNVNSNSEVTFTGGNPQV